MPTRPAYFRPKNARTVTDDRPTAYARGYDRDWQKLRLYHLQQNPLCVFCEDYAVIVDHRVPVVIDPSRRLDPSNLRSCCRTCHNRLTNSFKATGRNEMPDGTPERSQELAVTQELAVGDVNCLNLPT